MVRISESRNSTRMKIWEWGKNNSIQRELVFSSDQLVSSRCQHFVRDLLGRTTAATDFLHGYQKA